MITWQSSQEFCQAEFLEVDDMLSPCGRWAIVVEKSRHLPFLSGEDMSIQFSRTINPSTIVGCDLDNYQFFRVHTRTGALVGKFGMNIASAALTDVIALDTEAQATPSQFGPNHYVKLRDVFIDDKSGNFTLDIDYIHDKGVDPVFSEEDIKLFLGDGTVRYEGQGQWVNVSIKTGLFSSDYFSPVSDEYYK